MKHVEIIPDCPKCGRELNIVNKGNGPYTCRRPFGSNFTAWYECGFCGYVSGKYTAKHRDEAIRLAEDAFGAGFYKEPLQDS